MQGVFSRILCECLESLPSLTHLAISSPSMVRLPTELHMSSLRLLEFHQVPPTGNDWAWLKSLTTLEELEVTVREEEMEQEEEDEVSGGVTHEPTRHSGRLHAQRQRMNVRGTSREIVKLLWHLPTHMTSTVTNPYSLIIKPFLEYCQWPNCDKFKRTYKLNYKWLGEITLTTRNV